MGRVTDQWHHGWWSQRNLPVNRQTHMTENITFPKLHCPVVKTHFVEGMMLYGLALCGSMFSRTAALTTIISTTTMPRERVHG